MPTRLSSILIDKMEKMENGADVLASQAQLWRLNQLRLLELRDEPIGRALERREAKEVLAAAASRGLWQPAPRRPRGPVRADG
jgi:hypothetical protein